MLGICTVMDQLVGRTVRVATIIGLIVMSSCSSSSSSSSLHLLLPLPLSLLLPLLLLSNLIITIIHCSGECGRDLWPGPVGRTCSLDLWAEFVAGTFGHNLWLGCVAGAFGQHLWPPGYVGRICGRDLCVGSCGRHPWPVLVDPRSRIVQLGVTCSAKCSIRFTHAREPKHSICSGLQGEMGDSVQVSPRA